MLIVPRASVRVNLAIAILLTVVLSWILSTGITNYFNYLSLRSLRKQMMGNPDIYRRPIAEPKFGIMQFLIGPTPSLEGPGPGRGPGFGRPPGMRMGQGGPPGGRPGWRRSPPPSPVDQLKWLVLRLALALGLSSLAGIWLGRRFTRPLAELAKGADAFHAGDFGFRIPAEERNEFGSVATAMNEMARQVSDHINELEEDAERRRQFLADVAHELRSPVTTMRTMAGALQDGVADDPERTKRAISALVRTSERLLRLVLELMELAKLDLMELPLNRQSVDLRDLAESAVQSREAEAVAAGIKLNSVVSQSAIVANVDPDRIVQVIDNLLDNAIGYAGEGAEVSVVLEDGDPVRITISDTGRGIPASDLPRVTDSFYRADPARTPSDSHFGLGLSIARRLVEAHGGSLTVSSEEGRGTTVVVSLPATTSR